MNQEVFKKAVSGLNNEQKAAVEAIEGPVMVNAGPGTGKTQILTLRIANILDRTDTKPEQILALTFTNAGSFTMRERLSQYVGDVAYRVNISTFHSFCKNVITHNPDYFPQFEYAQVIDDLQKVKIIESIIDNGSFKHLTGTHDEYQKVQDITRALNTIKKEGLNAEQFKNLIPIWKDDLYQSDDLYYKRKYKEFAVGDIRPIEEEKIKKKLEQAYELVELYLAYQQELSEKKLYDFSDMILTVLEKLRTNEDFKFDLQEQYQYILVDEHQDTNEGQNELIELLTDAEHLEKRPNIFTVGDEKQSIYRFQGASEETFKYFNSLYKDIRHISLVQNYRSTQNILSASSALIAHSIDGAIELHSNTKDNNPIEIGAFSNYKFELLYIVDEIKKKIESGVGPEDIAILYRANKHLGDIKLALAHKQIPFSVYSKDSVFEDTDISNIILLLRVIVNPFDEESLGKALFINFLKIDGYDSFKILSGKGQYLRDGKKLLDIISDPEILDALQVQGKDSILNFSKIIRDSIIEVKNQHIFEFMKIFLEKIGYMKYVLQSSLSRDKMLKLDKLFDEMKKQDAKSLFGIDHFINLVDSYHAYRIDIESGNSEIHVGVQLMTAHGSKGKEFEYVYMINTTRSNWEKSRSFGGISLPIQDYKGDEHDERRLFYVAMTRARRGLSITYSKSDWEGREQEKSQFVTEIPAEFVSEINSSDYEEKNIYQFALFLQPANYDKTIYDREFIKERFLKRGLTVTALNNYLSCPVKYFYRSLIQIPSGYSPHMQYGNVVHTALEKFMLECKASETILPSQRLLDLFSLSMDYSSLRDQDKKKYLKQGLESLESWYKSRAQTIESRVLTEQKINRDFELADGTLLRINGTLDKIEFLDSEMEGAINVVDYKTGKGFSKKSREQKEDLKRQLAFYHILLEDYKDGAYQIKNTSLDFIEPNQKGESEFVSLLITQDDIDELKNKVRSVASEIMAGEFLKNGCCKKDCEWCSLHHSSLKE